MTLLALQQFMQHPIVHGVIIGILGAAGADFHAFKSWQSFHDAAVYNWSTAAWRWLQGAILGLASAAGLSALGL